MVDASLTLLFMMIRKKITLLRKKVSIPHCLETKCNCLLFCCFVEEVLCISSYLPHPDLLSASLSLSSSPFASQMAAWQFIWLLRYLSVKISTRLNLDHHLKIHVVSLIQTLSTNTWVISAIVWKIPIIFSMKCLSIDSLYRLAYIMIKYHYLHIIIVRLS